MIGRVGVNQEVCFVCERAFDFDHDHYNKGLRIQGWGVMVCTVCFDANVEGIVPTSHRNISDRLKALGHKPKLNTKGWIEWPPNPGGARRTLP